MRYDIPKPTKITTGKTVGADTGLKTVVTLSNNIKTPEKDNHGHSLESVCKKLVNKKKGSKAFKRSQDHRLNFINWSINKLNFNGISTVNLEHLHDMNRGKRTSKLLTAWSAKLIHAKIVKVLEETGVQLLLQSSPYRSQRCSGCGMVFRGNRKGKEYKCKGCHLNLDSDLNAALNHEIDLPEIPFFYRSFLSKLDIFYWKESGLYDKNGQELRVSATNK